MQRAVFAGIFLVLVGVGLAVGLMQERQSEGATLEISTDPSRALVNITGPEGFMSMLDLSGPEALTDLAPGQYFIVATSPDHSVSQAEIELSQGATESVSLKLESLADVGQQQDGQQQNGQQQDGQQQNGQQQDGQQQNGQQQNAQQSQVGGGGQAQSGQQGEQAFQQQCAQCHGQQGEGGTGPALAGNQIMQDPQAVITQILQGGGGMPAFGEQLSNEQIAAIATHEMNSWGNQFGEVSPDQVQQQRSGGQGQQQQGQQQQAQQQQDQQQQGQQGQGQQAQGQAGQQGQQQGQSGQPDVQVQRGGDATRIEIMLPAASDATVSLNLQLEIGASEARATGPSQSPGGEQVSGGGQPAGQGQQQQQGQQGQGQQQGQQAQGQQQGQQEQGQQQQGQQQQGQPVDPAQQGTLQIDWVQPAGATVTVTGPDGFSRQTNLTGGTVFEGLRAGSYTVTATSPGYESVSKQVEVEARQTASISLSLQQQTGQQRAGQQQAGQQQAGQQQTGQQQAGQQQDGQQQAGQQQAGQQQTGQQQAGQQQDGQQQAGQQGADQQVAGGGQAQQGSQIYGQQCAQCHGQEGGGGAGPALAGNQALQDPQAVVTQILQGGGGMPAFGNQLSDEQVAAVATHEMNSWGNQFGEVTPDQVSQQRNGGQQQTGQQQSNQQQDGQQAGNASTQRSSWFTAEQARRGMQEYASHCAVCHGGGLQGRASYPALVGDDFLGKWQGRTAAELFEYISTKMPQDRPGKLGHLTYTYLTAYVLDQNGLPAGQTELAPESGELTQLILPGPSGDGGPQQEGQPPAPVGQETEQPEQDQQ